MGEMTAAEMGAFIAKTRKARNMTQSELAQRLNVTSQAVSRWERGLGFPDIGTLLPLADALGIGIDELINTKRKDDDQFSAVTAVGSIQKTICIAIEQINGSKWRKMVRLEILLCYRNMCSVTYSSWRLCCLAPDSNLQRGLLFKSGSTVTCAEYSVVCTIYFDWTGISDRNYCFDDFSPAVCL